MIKNIFLALKKRIETETQIPVYWYSETRLRESDSNEDLYKTPSVHIEFSDLPAKNMTRHLQQFEMSFNLHIVDESLFDHEDTETLIKSVDQAELVNSAIYMQSIQLSLLTGNPAHTDTIINTIHRTRVRVDHSPTNLYITVMEYRCICWDFDNLIQYIAVEPPIALNITTEFVD